jgi:hypothetical protein
MTPLLSGSGNEELRKQCPPVRTEREGIKCYRSVSDAVRLLLVVDSDALEFLTLRIGPVRCDGAALAIG